MIETREHPKQTIEVFGKQMSYVEMGEGVVVNRFRTHC